MKTIGACSLLLGAILVLFWSQQPSPSELKLKALTQRNEEGPKPEFPGEAAAYLAGLRQTPNDENPAALNLSAMDSIKARQAKQAGPGPGLPNLTIEDLGPGNFGGRIRSLVVHPTTPDNMLVGGVFGGVWKTTNGGLNWRAIDDFLPNLAISSMTLDPDDSNVVWMGTGEGFFNIDAARGLGLFRSADFGETWTQVAATNTSDFYYVNRIARVPASDIILLTTRTGIYRSTNGGTSFTEVSGQSTSSRGFVDVKVDPSLSTRLYAVHYGSNAANSYLMRSDNSGATWSRLGAAEGMPTTDISRMEIAIGSDGVIYLSVSNTATLTRGIWRSPAGGASFAKTASNEPYIPRQGWYDLMIGVNPTDSNTLFVGAVDVYRSTDAGATLNQVSIWNPSPGQVSQYIHSDIHNIAFHPTDSDTFWIVCDGGIFKSTDGGTSFISLNNDLRLIQNYGIAISPDGESVIGGTQDNGTHLYYGRSYDWLEWAGGDGGYCAWDQQQERFVYGSTPNGGMYGSSDGGLTNVSLNVPGSFPFIQAFTLDPNDGNRMMACGSTLVYSENVRLLDSSTWTDLGSIAGSLASATFSPHDASVAYVGSTNGAVLRTGNMGSSATFTNVSSNLPSGSDVTWITVDPFDSTSNTVYITLADYNGNRVWKTTNGGSSWTSIHSDLPNVPTFSLTIDPTDGDRLFLGSELGLWSSAGNNSGNYAWEHYDYGVAWTRLMQLRWGDNDTLYMGTHGRGTFRAKRESFSVAASDFAELVACDGDVYLDEGESASFQVTVTNTGGRTASSVSVSVTSDIAQLSLSGAQSLGSIAAGASAIGSFDVSLNGLPACLTEANFTVTVTDAVGSEEYSFTRTLGADADTQTGTFSETAESSTTLLTTEALLGVDEWSRVNTEASSGSFSWFAPDVATFADASLISPWLSVQGGTTTLSFDINYNMEGNATQYWDGAVLEMRVEGGSWFDIGNLSTVPYDGRLFTNNTNAGKPAWSGDQSSWRSATVALGSAYNGQNIQYRFRVICDAGAATAGGGVWIDELSMTNVQWLNGLTCDTSVCQSCFGTLSEAIQAMLDSSAAGEWPTAKSVTDYIENINNICPN